MTASPVPEIVAVLERGRFTWRTEADLQAELTAALTAAGWPAAREVRLTAGDRIDILAGRVGIEVKTQGSPVAVARQLQRYAHSPDLDVLVLATTRPQHQAAMPTEIGGTPLVVALIAGGAW